MGLAGKLAFQFDRRTQIQGQALFDSRAVRLVDAAEDHAHVDVADGRIFGARLALESAGNLSIGCNCPIFRSNRTCKHLWAAVLEADREGALSQAAGERL